MPAFAGMTKFIGLVIPAKAGIYTQARQKHVEKTKPAFKQKAGSGNSYKDGLIVGLERRLFTFC